MKIYSIIFFVLLYFLKIKETKCQTLQGLSSLDFRDKFFLRSFKRIAMLKDVKNELFDNNPDHILLILYFYTTWCPACKAQKGELEKLMNVYGSKIGLKKFDCDVDVSMAKKYSITSLPTIYIYKKSKLVHKSEKLIRVDELMKVIKKNL